MQTGLHRNTISKVYRQLEIDGVVEAIAGSGIYVRDNLTKREFKKSFYSKDKVKCTVIFRGREIQHSNLAETLLLKMANDLEEQSEVQQKPKREGRNMIMFLSPRKTPLIKKNDG